MTTTTTTDTGAAAAAAADKSAAATAAAAAAGSDTSGAPAGNTSTAPESYADFQLPEGVTLDASYLAQQTAAFKKAGLSQEQAQEIITTHAELVKAGDKSAADEWAQRVSTWDQEIAADKDFGGDKLQRTLKTAEVAISKFGGQGLNDLLKQTGLAKHPDMIRAFARIGGLLREDTPGDVTLAVGDNLSKEQRYVQTMYPSTH